MQYLEDVMELVEDLPDEMEKRFLQIRKWDQDVERLKLESNDLQKRILDKQSPIEMKERERLLLELGDKHQMMRELSEKKLDLTVRSERLMESILEKVNEGAYHCKIELEVDNPGCTDIIERNFCMSLGLRPSTSHLNSCTMEFEPLDADDRQSVASDDIGRGRPAKHISSSSTQPPSAIGHRKQLTGDALTTSKSSSKSGSPVPGHNLGKKYKKKKDLPLGGSMSAYMRKKHEKLREQQKLTEIHAKRIRDQKRKQIERENAHVPQLDLTSFCAQACSTNTTDFKRDESATPNGERDENMSWSGGLGDIGSDDDFDPNEALGLFPSMLPSPPREIMESLKEDSMFGLDDPMCLGISVSPATCSTQTTFPMMSNTPSPVHRSTSESLVQDSVDAKKKKNLMFGSVSDTSMHGRPRKLTDRAVELVQQSKEKMRKKEDDSEEKWCVCREGSSGQMIKCDAESCPIEWFHFDCLGLFSTPPGKWYCNVCKNDN